MVERYCAEHNITIIRTEDDRLGVDTPQGDTDVEEHIFFLETRENLIIQINTQIDSLLSRAHNLEIEISNLNSNFICNSDD